MKINEVLPFTQVLEALGRPVYYYPVIGRALDSNDAAVFLGNFMYWEGKQADKKNRFIFKNANDIFTETGLKRSRQENARKILRKAGILEEKKEDFPPKVYYRFHWDVLDKLLTEFLSTNDIDECEESNDQGEKKNPPPKPKDKPPAEPKEEKLPSVIFQMKEIFDEIYQKVPGYEIGYEWSKDKKGGKDWKNLKLLRDALISRAINRKKKLCEKEKKPVPEKIEIPDEEVVVSWRLFLENLTPYHIKTNFTPAKLYSNLNPILQDISNANKEKQQPEHAGAKSGARSTAADYAD